MLQSTPMSCNEDINAARACQPPDVVSENVSPLPLIVAWARTGPVDVGRVLAAVARAYTATYDPAVAVTPDAILGPRRLPAVARARHLCAYLLVEDYHLTCQAAGQVLGRRDHTTILNSKARIVAALASHDGTLAATLAHARATLTGCAPAVRARIERSRDRAHSFAGATPAELAEYRYWRLRFLRTETSYSGAPQGAALGGGVRS